MVSQTLAAPNSSASWNDNDGFNDNGDCPSALRQETTSSQVYVHMPEADAQT